MSIAGGVDQAMERGRSISCETIQLFTKNSNQWQGKPLGRDEIRRFREGAARYGVGPNISHTSYLINIASPDKALREKSIQALGDELDRAEALDLACTVLHPGSHVGSGEEAGILRVARSIRKVLGERKRAGYRVRLCLEITAGQGTNLGCRFEQIAQMLELADLPERTGVCFDTCHVLAAGYDLRTAQAYQKTMKEFDEVIGLDRLFCFHLNDSLKPFGSRRDRHEQIGKGHVGLEGFRALVNDRRFHDRPMLLETPKGEDLAEDVVNLKVLRGLLRKSSRVRG
jgi:deoxyribonuclease-4